MTTTIDVTAPADDARARLQQRERAFLRLTAALEWPMIILAMAVVPALLLETRATSVSWRAAGAALNWIVWVAFCVEFLAKLLIAPRRAAYVRSAWLNLSIIVLSPPFLVPDAWQGVRSARALRLVRLLRLLRGAAAVVLLFKLTRRILQHRRFHYVGAAAVITVALGAIGVYSVESAANPNIGSLGDAVWWALVTITTVGYGDVSPVTTEGRVIAVILMLTGIAVMGVFTATVASFFFENSSQEQTDLERVSAQVRALDAKMDRVLDALQRRRDP